MGGYAGEKERVGGGKRARGRETQGYDASRRRVRMVPNTIWYTQQRLSFYTNSLPLCFEIGYCPNGVLCVSFFLPPHTCANHSSVSLQVVHSPPLYDVIFLLLDKTRDVIISFIR